MAILSSLFLLASAQVIVPEPLPAEIHNFADWVVACDNGLRCSAVSLVPEPTPAEQEEASRTVGTPEAQPQKDPWERFGVLRLERDAGPDAPLVMLLSDFEGTPTTLTVYDTALEARITPGSEGEWRIEPNDPKGFFSSLYSGTMLVKDAAGQTISEIALDGAIDALVYMEERQGRLRTQGAVGRPGNWPNSLVPTAPALPVVRAAPATSERPLTIPARRMAEARSATGCDQEDVGAPAHEPSIHALGNGRTLIMLACGAGAYNFSTVPLIAWREGSAIRIEPARFDVSQDWSGEEGETREGYYVTNAEFDEASLTISEYAKGRGIGDCSTQADYVWDGERFRLLTQRAMDVCRGTLEVLTTWRADRR